MTSATCSPHHGEHVADVILGVRRVVHGGDRTVRPCVRPVRLRQSPAANLRAGAPLRPTPAVSDQAAGSAPAGERPLRAPGCLLYTSDAADDLLCVDLGGRRII